MIEDLQDELQAPQPEKKEKQPHRRGAFLLLAFVIWLVYAGVMALVFMPKMVAAFRDSDIVAELSRLDERKEANTTKDARLCFVIPKADGSTKMVTCNQKVTITGASGYHDVVEGLLKGPGPEALSTGAISFIEKETSLIGLTVSEDTAFVNLSETFTSSGSNWGAGGLDIACRQITMSLQAYDPGIQKVVILINGSILSV